MALTEQQKWLIQRAKDWEQEHLEPPKASDWKGTRGTHWPSYQTVYRAFGSWDAYIALCGWRPRGRGRPSK